MKKSFYFLIIFILSNSIYSIAQTNLQSISPPKSTTTFEKKLKLHSKENTEVSSGFLKALVYLFPFNPIFQFQDNKFYVGITKEISLIAYPYGRIAVEYSLIFRETRLNQVRASYNYDFGMESGDFFALLFSIGGGYFTDFYDVGYFPQAAVSLLLPFGDKITTVPYFKIRETFMTKGSPDIFDISLGLGLYFSF